MGKAFYRFVLSFLLVIIVCVSAFGIYSYNHVTRDAKQRAIANNEILLNISRDKIDGALLELDKNLIQNGLVIETFDGLSLPDSHNTDYLSQKKNINLNNFVGHLNAGSEILDSVAIYYKNESVFLTSNGRFWESEFWDQKIAGSIKNDNSNTIWIGPRNIYSRLYSRNIWGISYIRQLPLVTSYKKAAFIANIDLIKLSTLVDAFEDRYQSTSIYIVDSDGVVLADKGKELIGRDISVFPFISNALENSEGYDFCKDENNKEILMSYVKSNVAEWKYIIIAPMDSLFESSRSIIKSTIYMCIVIILIGTILSILLSRQLYTPIHSLISMLGQTTPWIGKNDSVYDEYAFINELFTELQSSNKYLNEQLRSNLETVREKLFLDILKGHVAGVTKIAAILRDYGYSIEFRNYIVIAIEIDDEERIELFGRGLCLFSIKNIVDEMINVEYNGFVTSEDNTVLALIDFPHDDYQFDYKYTGEYLCSQIQKNIEKFIDFKVSIGVSRCYDDIERLPTAYMEAKEAIKYILVWENHPIIFIKDMEPKGHGLRNYPYQLSRDLIKYIKTGDIQNTKIILCEIVNFFKDSKFTYENVQQFFIQFMGLFMMSLNDMGYEASEIFGERPIYRELEDQKTLEDIHIWLEEISYQMIDFIMGERQRQSRDMVLCGKEYIDKNYMNPELSLTLLAERLYISDSYLSRIFKQEVGMNFWDYITNKRIEKAKELLLKTELNINDIAIEAGFSVQSFIRNFKKYEGMTPGKYREEKNI